MKPSEFFQRIVQPPNLHNTDILPLNEPLNDMMYLVNDLTAEEQESFKKCFNYVKYSDTPQTLNNIIEDINNEIRSSIGFIPCDAVSFFPRGEVFAGVVPTDSYSGCIVKCQDGYLILFNRCVIQLMHCLSRMLFQTVKIKNDRLSIVQDNKINWDEIIEYFRNTITNCLHSHRVEKSPPHLRSLNKILLADMITRHAEKFAMWHQWCHILMGHLETAEEITINISGYSVSAVRSDFKNELTADANAAQSTVMYLFDRPKRVNMKNDFERTAFLTSFVGPIFLLHIFNMIEKISQTKPIDHPPAHIRLKMIRKTFEPLFPVSVFDIVDSFDSLLTTIYKQL